MKKLALFLLGMLVVYLIAAFISWELNPGAWDLQGRLAVGLFAPFVGGILVLAEDIK